MPYCIEQSKYGKTVKCKCRGLGNFPRIPMATNATNQILTEALPSAGALLLQIYEEVFVTDHQLNLISFPPGKKYFDNDIAYTNLQESVIQHFQRNDLFVLRQKQVL